MAHPGGLRLQTAGVFTCIAAIFRASARVLSLRGDRKQRIRKLGKNTAEKIQFLIAELYGEGVCKRRNGRRKFTRIHAPITPMLILCRTLPAGSPRFD